jgi:hypothetical protein
MREHIFYRQYILFCQAVYAKSFDPDTKSGRVIPHLYLVTVFCGALAGGISPD